MRTAIRLCGGGADAALRALSRRADGGRRSGRDPCGAHAALRARSAKCCATSCWPPIARMRVPAALQPRRRIRGPACAAQPLPRLSHGDALTAERVRSRNAQFDRADNMTDAMAALAVLADFDCAERTRSARSVLRTLEGRAARRGQMAARAGDVAAARHARGSEAPHRAPGVFDPESEQGLCAHRRVQRQTTCAFMRPTAAATHFLADQIIALDKLNPQVAARMARAFDRWKKFDAGRQRHARARSNASAPRRACRRM